MSQTDRLRRYITEYKNDSHIAEAMFLLGMSRPQLCALAKCLPPDVLLLSGEFSKLKWNQPHIVGKAIQWLLGHRFIAKTEMDFRTPTYTFTVAGFTKKGELVKVVECGPIYNRESFYPAAHAIDRVYHWPTDDAEPHKLGGCSRCGRFKTQHA